MICLYSIKFLCIKQKRSYFLGWTITFFVFRSDTESADLRPKDTKRIVSPIKLTAIFKKNKGKGDSEAEQRPNEGENGSEGSEEKNDADNASTATAPVDDGKGLVYAELDLVRTDLKPVLKNEDEKTEYAEIVYTPKTEDHKETNSDSPKMQKSPEKDESPKKWASLIL